MSKQALSVVYTIPETKEERMRSNEFKFGEVLYILSLYVVSESFPVEDQAKVEPILMADYARMRSQDHPALAEYTESKGEVQVSTTHLGLWHGWVHLFLLGAPLDGEEIVELTEVALNPSKQYTMNLAIFTVESPSEDPNAKETQQALYDAMFAVPSVQARREAYYTVAVASKRLDVEFV